MHLCIHSCWYDISINYTGWWYTYPSENMSSSVGIILPNIWKNHPNVPNHQPDIIRVNILIIIYYMYLCMHSWWYDTSINYTGWWYTYPSENMSLSVGIILPNIWKNHPNVPNHLPDIIRVNILIIIYYMYLCIHSWCYDTSINYTLWWFTHSHDHPWPQRTSLVVLGCPGPQRLALQRSLAAVSGWLHWIALDQGPVAGEKTWGIFWGKICDQFE